MQAVRKQMSKHKDTNVQFKKQFTRESGENSRLGSRGGTAVTSAEVTGSSIE